MTQDVPFEFQEVPACRGTLIPLGGPAQLKLSRQDGQATVTVLSNFGCSTHAGDARVQREGFVFVLSARTILNDGPLMHCKCTRELTYRFPFADESVPRGGFGFIYVQDGRIEVERRTVFLREGGALD